MEGKLFLRCEAGQRIGDRPLVRQMKKFPFAAALCAAVVMTVFLFPAGVFVGRVPDDLGIRPYKEIVSPAFQLFAAGGVEYFIISPVVCNPHK